MIQNIGVKRENGKYILDLGIEANELLAKRYKDFVEAVNEKRKDLSEEEKANILLDEETQNCRLIREWMQQLFKMIRIEAKLDQENNALVEGPPDIKDECQVFVADITPEQVAAEINNYIDEHPESVKVVDKTADTPDTEA
jgi:hypothetical protein